MKLTSNPTRTPICFGRLAKKAKRDFDAEVVVDLGITHEHSSSSRRLSCCVAMCQESSSKYTYQHQRTWFSLENSRAQNVVALLGDILDCCDTPRLVHDCSSKGRESCDEHQYCPFRSNVVQGHTSSTTSESVSTSSTTSSRSKSTLIPNKPSHPTR